uniref:SJCHGC02983 protein n=1 Tax=Schistosoma japonicum TaxID=6182 RepID=Q5BT18_SCHJA|nr:SJCHGC02983 protein [Schistosoma japonicum]
MWTGKHYGTFFISGEPRSIVYILRNPYVGVHCKIVHRGQLMDLLEVKTGVRQDCMLLPFLLLVDWIMKTATSQGLHRIQWTSWMKL